MITPAIGIDFGTTNLARGRGRARALPLHEWNDRRQSIPSLPRAKERAGC